MFEGVLEIGEAPTTTVGWEYGDTKSGKKERGEDEAEDEAAVATTVGDSKTLWRANFDRWTKESREAACLAFVGERINVQAAQIYKVLLGLTRDGQEGADVRAVYRDAREAGGLDFSMTHSYLELMCKERTGMVRRLQNLDDLQLHKYQPAPDNLVRHADARGGERGVREVRSAWFACVPVVGSEETIGTEANIRLVDGGHESTAPAAVPHVRSWVCANAGDTAIIADERDFKELLPVGSVV